MLRIGHFSRIGHVSIEALRHYDAIGLLRPSYVDQVTGYRYYTLDQLPRLNRILALKDLGLSLEQIARLLEDTVTADEIRGMLHLRQAQLADQIHTMYDQLTRVEARLRQIEQEGTMPTYDVVLKTVEPILIAGRRIIVTENVEYPVGLPEAFAEVYRYAAEQRAELAGGGIAIWYTPVEATSNEDVEAAVPLKAPIMQSDRVTVHKLPRVDVAAVIHQGNFADFPQGYTALLDWIDTNGYQIAGPFREIYHKFNPDDQTDVTVEIQFPVTKPDA